MTNMAPPNLREQLIRIPLWTEDPAQGCIRRSLRFDDFAQAFAFMTRMAEVSERMNHHPEWFNVYNRVDILFSTHDAGGLTERDIAFAHWVDATAPAMGAIDERNR